MRIELDRSPLLEKALFFLVSRKVHNSLSWAFHIDTNLITINCTILDCAVQKHTR